MKIVSILRWLVTEVDLICPRKAEVQTLLRKASFLKVFLSCQGKWNIEDRDLRALLIRIDTVFDNTYLDLGRLVADCVKIPPEKHGCRSINMYDLLSSTLERLELLEPDIQEVYAMLSRSSRFTTSMSDEAVMGNLNSLQENMEDLLTCNTELVAPVKEELEAIQRSLRFLRNFLGFTAKRCRKLVNLKDLLIHAEFLADNISCLLYLCSVNDVMNDQMGDEMNLKLSCELQKFSPARPDVGEIYIKALKASKSAKRNSSLVDEFDLGFLDSLRDHVLELSDAKLCFITSITDQFLSLHEELRFLTTFFAMDISSKEHSEHDHMSNTLLQLINTAIIDIGCVIYSLHNDEQNEEKAREWKMAVSNLQDTINIAKEEARNAYDMYLPKSLRSNFPRTNGQGFIGSLSRNLKELLNTKSDLVAPVEQRIEEVQKELLSVREDFNKTAQQPSQCEKLQSQWTRFVDAAYQTEYVIDSFVGGGGPLCCQKLGLFNVIEEIKTIKIELASIENKMTDDTSVHKHSCFSSPISLEANFPKNNTVLSSKRRLADEKTMTKLVIFGEEAKKIRERLTNGSEKLNFLSIVGMPGIGKTTLADSVFQHSLVTRHFHVLARCSVSQVHDKSRMLLEILQQVTGESKQYSKDDLDQELYKSLKGRRYLIFMDDMWSIRSWEDVRASFPDDKNGSRIIFTSRFEYIASRAGSESIKYLLSPLSEDKSWEMLQMKIFGDNSCPQELLSVGREIAANCKGLPLTVDLIAGILRATKREEWKKVADSMMSLLLDDPQGQCRKVLELSYHNLPDELKSCFLYFAAFPEDAEIPTRKLILLWIAEGFVQLPKDDLRSLEDAAEHILNDLIARSLVTVSERGHMGGVEASRVHDLLHEFVLAKAQEESFMLKIDGKANFSTLSSGGYQWREQYRLCIYPGNWEQFNDSNPSGPRARALICSDRNIAPALPRLLDFSNFKLLKVLVIPQVSDHCFRAILTLIHLRVLVVFSFGSRFLSEIHELRNLETFVTGYGYAGLLLYLHEICNMVRLRHFCSSGYFSLTSGTELFLEKSFLFDNLRTLYHLRISYEENIEKILKLMPNLVELKVIFYKPDSGCYPFPKLYFLEKLESLEVTHEDRFYEGPCKIISFPPHLKELVLSNFWVPWTEISELGNFEYLESLNLQGGAFQGSIWDMVDGQFPKLKYLSLRDLDIAEWHASEDHLSCIEQLRVVDCRKLKELPSCLAEIATLQGIKLAVCSSSVRNSAKRIKEEQEETGNEQFVLVDADDPTHRVSWRSRGEE